MATPGVVLPSQPRAAQPPLPMTSTRWRKTPTTFGPAGRLAATVALFVPLLVMVVGGFAVMFAWGGALVYAGVVLPWGLRDIWRAGRLPLS